MMLDMPFIDHAVKNDVRLGNRRQHSHVTHAVDQLLPCQALGRCVRLHKLHDRLARLQAAGAVPEKRHHVIRQIGIGKLLRVCIALRLVIDTASRIQIDQHAVCFRHQPLHTADRCLDFYGIKPHGISSSHIIDYLSSILFSFLTKRNSQIDQFFVLFLCNLEILGPLLQIFAFFYCSSCNSVHFQIQ